MSEDRIRLTKDGSHTLYNSIIGETYHSSFGAIQESRHIFIDAGLGTVLNNTKGTINILEVGIGTGLNVLLTYCFTLDNDAKIVYDGYEPFPISNEEISLLNYSNILDVQDDVIASIHSQGNANNLLSSNFHFNYYSMVVQEACLPQNHYNLVYFDAFSPESQPEMWDVSLFEKIYNSMQSGGILTTYSCKGVVKRALKEAGFDIEKLPGPPGKREFLRAIRPLN